MVITVQIQGTNQTAQFPDGTSRDVIQNAISQRLGTPQQAPIQPTVSPIDIAGAEGEAIASGRLGTNLQFAADPRIREAQIKALTPDVPGFIGAIGTVAQQVPLDIPGGIGGTALGAAAGIPLGPPGMLAGGIIGGITGGTAGKQADVALGRRPEETVAQSLGQSAIEEATGLGLGVVGNLGGRLINTTIIKPFTPQMRNLANKLGINLQKTSVETSFITSQSIDPTNVLVRDILEAQDNVLDSRLLTTFEETGGQVGGGQFRKLVDRVSNIRTKGKTTSTAIANRKKINDRIASKLGDFKNIKPDALMKTDSELGNSLKSSFNQASKSFQPEIGAVVQDLRKLRPQAKVPINGLKSQIDVLKQDAITELGNKDANALFNVLDDFLVAPEREVGQLITGQIPTQIKSFADFKRLNRNIESALPNFQDNQEIQKRILGWYAGNVKPIIQDFKLSAVEKAGPESILGRTQASEKLLANLKEAEGTIRNSNIFKKIGGTERRQDLKGVFSDDVLDKVYAGPESWQQTVAALERTNPELINTLQGRFKAQIVRDIFDPKTGDISFEKIASLKKNIGDDTIAAIGGQKYLQALDDSQQIALALSVSRPLAKAGAKLEPAAIETAKGLVRPLQQGVTIFNILTTNAKKLFNLDSISDEVLFRKLQGTEGQLLFERMLSTPLESPEAFLLYSSLARDVIKEKDILNSEEFIQKRDELLNDVGTGIQQLTQ